MEIDEIRLINEIIFLMEMRRLNLSHFSQQHLRNATTKMSEKYLEDLMNGFSVEKL